MFGILEIFLALFRMVSEEVPRPDGNVAGEKFKMWLILDFVKVSPQILSKFR